jgi:hypothetical protein
VGRLRLFLRKERDGWRIVGAEDVPVAPTLLGPSSGPAGKER